jgi:hypothetical protein
MGYARLGDERYPSAAEIRKDNLVRGLAGRR